MRPDLPAAVEDVILRQLAKKPGERYRPARAFAEALAEAVHEANSGRRVAHALQRRRPSLPVGSARDGQSWGLDRPTVPAGRAADRVTVAGHRDRPGRLAPPGWTALVVGLSLLATGLLGYAAARETAVLSLIADMSGVGESRRASDALSAAAPTAAPTTAPTSPPAADGDSRAPDLGAHRRADRRHARDRPGCPHPWPGRPWSSRPTRRSRRPSR